MMIKNGYTIDIHTSLRDSLERYWFELWESITKEVIANKMQRPYSNEGTEIRRKMCQQMFLEHTGVDKEYVRIQQKDKKGVTYFLFKYPMTIYDIDKLFLWRMNNVE